MICSAYVPTGVPVAVVTVSVEEPDPVTDAGAKPAVAPEGNPLTEKLTMSVNPFNAFTVTVYGTFPPCTTDREVGEVEIEKSGAGLTVIFLVGGLGSVKLALSVTVSVAVNVPAAE